MAHIVVSEPFNCPRCDKSNMGASVTILDFIVCPKCYYEDFCKELEPTLKEMIRDYFKVTTPLAKKLESEAKPALRANVFGRNASSPGAGEI